MIRKMREWWQQLPRIIEYPSRKAMAMDWIGGKRMMEWLPIAMEDCSLC